jgi:hypothetical protein
MNVGMQRLRIRPTCRRQRQNHSKTENQRKILGIQIPEPRLNTKLKYTMIPSELTVSVSGVDVSYPGVVFTQDWQYDKNVMTLSSDNNGTKVFQVTKSVHIR